MRLGEFKDWINSIDANDDAHIFVNKVLEQQIVGVKLNDGLNYATKVWIDDGDVE